jgi:hypothetical protein
MYWRFIIRFLMLTLGFALTTLGLLGWQQSNFDLASIWPISDEFRAHPVYAMVLGLALIPPTLWEIFVLEHPAGPAEKAAAPSQPGDAHGD